MQSPEEGVKWTHFNDERLTERLMGQCRASGGGDGCGASAAGAVRARRSRGGSCGPTPFVSVPELAIHRIASTQCLASGAPLQNSCLPPQSNSATLFIASALLTHFHSTCALLQHSTRCSSVHSFLSVHSFPALFNRSNLACTLCTMFKVHDLYYSNVLFHFWSTNYWSPFIDYTQIKSKFHHIVVKALWNALRGRHKYGATNGNQCAARRCSMITCLTRNSLTQVRVHWGTAIFDFYNINMK